MTIEADDRLASVFKADGPRILSALIKQFNDFDLAQDALQDALAAALHNWRTHASPENPGAWLYVVARNRAIDRLRGAAARRTMNVGIEIPEMIEQTHTFETEDIPDERLRLMFTCCHPALNHDAAVALTLQTLAGLSTAEIARAYLVSESTMARRLDRVKLKIREARIPFEIPGADTRRERMHAVLDVIYIIFNTGYSAPTSAGETRPDLRDEALRLGRLMHELAPEPECAGLLALMLLHESRRPAAFVDGVRKSLEEQNRELWDQARLKEGRALLRECIRLGRPGLFQIQAAISAVHSESPTFAQTDWSTIVELYESLAQLDASPVVRLNLAVAVSFARGPLAGLRLLGPLRMALRSYQPYHAGRADMLRRLGRFGAARRTYAKALHMTEDSADRLFLKQRLASMPDA